MKTRSRKNCCHFELQVLSYANAHYLERLARLEATLARKPRMLQIDLIGVGEIPADSALLIRSVLLGRSPGTRIVTNARSSLQGASVLVWLLGDSRIIRDDAKLYFRRANLPGDDLSKQENVWNDDEPEFCDSFSAIDPEEGDYARVLELINEFLPVRELAGRLIEVPVLRQFGLVDHEKVDHFLAAAFGARRESPDDSSMEPTEKKRRSGNSKPRLPWPVRR